MALRRTATRDLILKRVDTNVTEVLKHYGKIAGAEDGGAAFSIQDAALDVLGQHFERKPTLQVAEEPKYEALTLKGVPAEIADELERMAKSVGVPVERVVVAIVERFAQRNRGYADLCAKHGGLDAGVKVIKGTEEEEEVKPKKAEPKKVEVKKPVKEEKAVAAAEVVPPVVGEAVPVGWGTAS